jgi:hypothetical protein
LRCFLLVTRTVATCFEEKDGQTMDHLLAVSMTSHLRRRHGGAAAVVGTETTSPAGNILVRVSTFLRA